MLPASARGYSDHNTDLLHVAQNPVWSWFTDNNNAVVLTERSSDLGKSGHAQLTEETAQSHGVLTPRLRQQMALAFSVKEISGATYHRWSASSVQRA